MILAVAIAIGALLTWMLQRPTALLAVRIGAVSRIRSDRWSHPAPLQRLAGLAFSIPAIACCIWVSYNALALSLAFLVLLGMIDDAKELKPAVKFLGQIVAVLPYTLLSGSFSMQPVLLFWLLLHINAANMFDNMDGSLALVAAICLIGSGAMLYAYSPSAVFAFALAGGLLCFLRINWHPAKAFMGDTGSMVVGMVLGILS
ncbi:MAG TPA: MraY family glycosyltransferase, partial [Candidatus Kapabacteria bacterium]|nr:MraY family glycosyltransferase [Candidatus Kapabacteria bacterium]